MKEKFILKKSNTDEKCLFKDTISSVYFWMRSTPVAHDHCISYLGQAHAEAVFIDGTCNHCESMAIRILWSGLKEKVTSVDPHPSPFAGMHKAAAAITQGDWGILMEKFPLG